MISTKWHVSFQIYDIPELMTILSVPNNPGMKGDQSGMISPSVSDYWCKNIESFSYLVDTKPLAETIVVYFNWSFENKS